MYPGLNQLSENVPKYTIQSHNHDYYNKHFVIDFIILCLYTKIED